MSAEYCKVPRLRPGSTVGIVALSSPCEEGRFKKAISAFEGLGYQTKVGLSPWANYGSTEHLFSSDSLTKRAKVLTDFIISKEIKAIIPARGGYGAMELLPVLDLALLAKHQKPVLGFSDGTSLVIAYAQTARVCTFHGPLIEGTWAKMETDQLARRSVATLLALLSGETKDPFAGHHLVKLAGPKKGEGFVLGGNLSILAALSGTPWDIKTENHLLFLEDVGEPPHRLHRYLTQLKLAGKFERVGGVVLGEFKDCVHAKGTGPTTDQVFEDIFKDAKFPVLKNGPFGHGSLNLPFPLGVKARISEDKLEFMDRAVLN